VPKITFLWISLGYEEERERERKKKVDKKDTKK